MAIVKITLDPNAQYLSDDEVVNKVNAAAVNVTRANAVAEAALPAETPTFQKLLETERTKLTGVEENAKDDQTGPEVKDLVVALPDDDREILISRPITGEFKVYAEHVDADGKVVVEKSDTAEP